MVQKNMTENHGKDMISAISTYAKDILTADFNRDGKTDIVARGVDETVRVYIQNLLRNGVSLKIEVPAS